MKAILLILCMGLVSCAHRPSFLTTDLPEQDVLGTESIQKYGEIRLSKLTNRPALSALGQCKHKDIDDGLYSLKEQYKDSNKSPLYWNSVGSCFLSRQDYAKAIFYYKFAMSLKSTNKRFQSVLFNNMGVAYGKLGHANTALALFKKSIKLNSSMTARYNMGHLFLENELLRLSEKVFTKLYKEAPKDIEVLNALGGIALRQGKSVKALSYYKQIDEFYRTRGDISLHFAASLYAAGKYQEALNVLDDGYFVSNIELKDITRDLVFIIKREMRKVEVGS